MDFQQKAAALNALSEITIKCRGATDWYVSQRVRIIEGPMVKCVSGNGTTPEAAVLDHWEELVDNLNSDEYLAVDALSEHRRVVRWNGFMWADVKEPEAIGPLNR